MCAAIGADRSACPGCRARRCPFRRRRSTPRLRPAAARQNVVLAGGCFWGMQAVYEHTKGVTQAVSGYSGGSKETAHYEMVGTERTGHAESVSVTFDPRQISLGKILQIYFSVAHNPTELDYQGPDSGSSYRSAIFYANDEQKRVAVAYIAQLDKAHVFEAPIVTKLEAAKGLLSGRGLSSGFCRHPSELSLYRLQRFAEGGKPQAHVPGLLSRHAGHRAGVEQADPVSASHPQLWEFGPSPESALHCIKMPGEVVRNRLPCSHAPTSAYIFGLGSGPSSPLRKNEETGGGAPWLWQRQWGHCPRLNIARNCARQSSHRRSARQSSGTTFSSMARRPDWCSASFTSPTTMWCRGRSLAFGTYFIGFAARPIGAAIFGHYGDRIGRKATLIATLLCMGLATFAIAFVPTYDSIGIWGAVILTVLRAIQGIGVGGEWGGSVLLAMEWSRTHNQRGLVAAWPQFGVPCGLLLSTLAVIVFSSWAGADFLTWGWRDSVRAVDHSGRYWIVDSARHPRNAGVPATPGHE